MKKDFSVNSFAAGVALGIVLTSSWFIGERALPAAPVSATLPLATSTPASGAVSVADQKAGMTVAIESVTVPPPGVWVAVRETDGADLGNVLGAVLVGGPRSSVSVPLLRATEPGRRYAVELYRNDGNGTFDLGALSVYVDFDTGEPVIDYFTTSE